MAKRLEGKVLTNLETVKTLRDLTDALDNLNKDAWLWLDFFIGVQLDIAGPGVLASQHGQIWNADSLWEKVLCSFRLGRVIGSRKLYS